MILIILHMVRSLLITTKLLLIYIISMLKWLLILAVSLLRLIIK